MKLTNKYHIPEAIVRAIENDPYSKGDADFSVTELIKPSRIVALERKYKDEIVEDASDRIYSLYGQIAHGILERAGDSVTELVEKRLFVGFDDVIVSGQIDTLTYKSGVLTDYKFTTTYKFMANKAVPPEFESQLNMQRYLLKLASIEVNQLQIVGLLRDWSIREASRRTDYPQFQIAVMPIPLWPHEFTCGYIMGRIRSHRAAIAFTSQETLAQCTPDEHWNYKRCQSYCSVSKWCNQYNLKRGKDESRASAKAQTST